MTVQEGENHCTGKYVLDKYEHMFYYSCKEIRTNKKARDGNRTRLSSLGSWRSTDELYPHEPIITANEQKEKQKIG